MFKNFKVTPAMSIVFHSGIGLAVGVLISVLTAVGQAVLNTGSNLQVVYGVGVAAFLTSLGHSFVSLRNNPQMQTALSDTASELHVSPALVPDLESFARQIAPVLAGELMKIRTPPVSALQPLQKASSQQQINQQLQQQRPSQGAVNNPGNTFQGNQSYAPNQYGGGGYPQGTMPADQGVWNLATGQVEVPAQPYPGRPG